MFAWWRDLNSWIRSDSQAPCSLDAAHFDELCRERPDLARQALASDQRELMAEFERLYAVYERRLADLGIRVRGLSPQTEAEELGEVRAAQDSLRVIARRIEASSRAARELQRELYEWETREDEAGPRHADHPKIRAEIARSELEARGVSTRRRGMENWPSVSVNPSVEVAEDEAQECVSEETEEEEVQRATPEELLETIKMLTREVERWHGHSEVEPEVVDDLHELRALHAELKRQDRARRLSRDRLGLAVSPH